jgi:hypothetical protein
MRQMLLAFILWLAAAGCHAANATRAAVTQLHEEAAQRIATGQFEHLLAEADRYQKSHERIADGRWKLALLLGGMRRGFEAAARSPEDWAAFDRSLRALAAAHPDSPNAWLFVAVLEDSHAWAARGHGPAASVTTMGFGAFRSHGERARTLLEEHPTPGNPAWYALRISVGGALQESAETLDRLFDDAFRHEPDYHQTWFSRVMYLEPQWGGSADDVVRFALRGAKTISPAEGRGMLARVLWTAFDAGVLEALASPAVDWNVLKASMEDVLRRYPDDWNAQPFLLEACTRSDKAEARHLLTFVKEPPIPEALDDNVEVFKACIAWANSDLPVFRLRYDRGGPQLVR